MKITKQIRSDVHAILARSNEYDADTLRITRVGEVHARKDADKTRAGNDAAYYLVGDVRELLERRR